MSKLHCWPQGADSLMEETHAYETKCTGSDTRNWCDTCAGSANEGVTLGMTSQRKQHLNLTLRGK